MTIDQINSASDEGLRVRLTYLPPKSSRLNGFVRRERAVICYELAWRHALAIEAEQERIERTVLDRIDFEYLCDRGA